MTDLNFERSHADLVRKFIANFERRDIYNPGSVGMTTRDILSMGELDVIMALITAGTHTATITDRREPVTERIYLTAEDTEHDSDR